MIIYFASFEGAGDLKMCSSNFYCNRLNLFCKPLHIMFWSMS